MSKFSKFPHFPVLGRGEGEEWEKEGMRVTERGRGGEERINRRMKIEERSREIGKEGRGEKERRKRSGRAEEREKRKGNIFKREMER